MALFFWSDTHFNHRGIIGYCNRPYGGVEEMNEALVERWRSVVGPTDTVYLVGDFGFGCAEEVGRWFNALPGHKHLVVGNHDERNPKVLALPWESKSDLVTVRDHGRRVIACHYPLETWKNAQRGYLHVHGHSHGSLKRRIAHRWDVGCDVEPVPVSIDELFARAARQEFTAQDHHGD